MLTSSAIVSGTSAFFFARRFWVAKGRMSSHHSEGEPSRLQIPFGTWIEPPRFYQRMALLQGGRQS